MHLVSSSLPNSSQQGAAKKNRNGDSLLSKLLSPQTQVGGSMAKQASAGIRQHQQQGVAAAAAAATAVAVSMPPVGLSRANIEAAQPCLSPPDLGFPRNIEDNFTWGPRLGKGGNGVVRVVIDKRTGTEYACKSIVKVLKNGSDQKKAGHIASLKREIAVLKKLKGSLNIIDLEAVYEDDESVHIIMEQCTGGELSFAIGQRHYSERTVASYMRAVLRTLAQCHAHHILHRDVKPGNFMLLSADERAPLRAIDFGLAIPYEPQDLPLTNLGLEGTPWFQAPEVLSSQVTPASDVWSAGVMAYQLLTGRMPFDDHRNPMNPSITAIWKSVLSDKLNFNQEIWNGMSADAKDFVAKLLERDPAKRPSAKEALKHPFLVGDSRERSTGKQLQQSVVARIQRFASASEFKRSVLQMIASEMMQHPGMMPMDVPVPFGMGRPVVDNPASSLMEPLYKSLKFDGQDAVDASQIASALRELGFKLSQREIDRLLEQLDPAHTGKVSRTAFAASQVDWKHLQVVHKEAWLEVVRRVFSQLDINSDGALQIEEIMKHLSRKLPDTAELADIAAAAMEEAGQPATEMAMDFNDFVRMLKISSLDSLDMYDDRLASTLGSHAASIDRLNTLLQRAGSLGSLGGSKHGYGALRSTADDSQHSTTSTAFTDRTNHLFDFDMSQHGDNAARYAGAWRFDHPVGGNSTHGVSVTGISATARNAGGSAGGAWRFDVGGGVHQAVEPAAPKPQPAQQQFAPASMFRFDIVGPQSHATPVATPAWRFDVAGPITPPSPVRSNLSHSSKADDSVLGWRFDTAGSSNHSSNNNTWQQDVSGSRTAAGAHFDSRHHGSSLYKNSVVGSCRAMERSVHGGPRVLEPVQE